MPKENILPISLRGEPELDLDKVRMLADDALFLEFLRSLSLSLCYTGADYNKDDLRTSMPPQTIVPVNVYISPERDLYLAELATERVPDVKYKKIQTKMLRSGNMIRDALMERSARHGSSRRVGVRLGQTLKAWHVKR
ncbi:hypothetical protein OEA41_008796 [Lepraria neglecta]|uniref:Uncharacterized protein n=1 Tax=Lepraria neglecta TaxID=209136 RepID=A0AAD9Z2L5_9LECA|nr:hypothetical protein OEA41_008796 [Lepraria neglecta]